MILRPIYARFLNDVANTKMENVLEEIEQIIENEEIQFFLQILYFQKWSSSD